jgi:cell division ATPase FtsA
VVRDIEETTRAIAKAMKDAQLMAGVEDGTVYCGVAGEHVSGRSSHCVVSLASVMGPPCCHDLGTTRAAC